MSNYIMDYAKGDQGGENWNGPNVDPSDMPVPDDLKPYYRQLKGGLWVYVCPFCRHIWKPFWGGMPLTFRLHVMAWGYDSLGKEIQQGLGCCASPAKGKKDAGKKSSLVSVKDF